MASRFNVGYYTVEGVQSIFTHGFMSFAAICMTVACLLIMGSFSLLAVNLNQKLSDLEDENEFLAYVDDSLSREEALALQGKLEAVDNVSSVAFVTREEALVQFKESRQSNELLDELPAERLRDRYRIHVEDIQRMAATVTAVRNVEGIAKCRAAVEIAEGFVMVRNIATGVALILIAMLVLISLFIITNTIRLATFYRRDEIAIMKMCGATNAFVCWPFVVEGIILGLVGALLAFCLQWGLYSLVGRFVVEANGLSILTLTPYSAMATTILAVFCGTGLVIGVGGSLLGIRKFLQV